MQNREWRQLLNYERAYEINDHGQIRSLHKRNRHNLLSQRIDRGGYLTVRLTKHGKTATKFVHRLIAETFIPNLENKPIVNHRNGITLDNSIQNLEWVTHAENVQHAYQTQLISASVSKCRKVVDTCTNRLFASIKEAAGYLGMNYNTCRNILSGSNKNESCLKYAT